MFIFKILFFPFVFIWRLISGIFKFILITEVMITMLAIAVLAVLAYLYFHGDSDVIKKLLSAVHR